MGVEKTSYGAGAAHLSIKFLQSANLGTQFKHYGAFPILIYWYMLGIATLGTKTELDTNSVHKDLAF